MKRAHTSLTRRQPRRRRAQRVTRQSPEEDQTEEEQAQTVSCPGTRPLHVAAELPSPARPVGRAPASTAAPGASGSRGGPAAHPVIPRGHRWPSEGAAKWGSARRQGSGQAPLRPSAPTQPDAPSQTAVQSTMLSVAERPRSPRAGGSPSASVVLASGARGAPAASGGFRGRYCRTRAGARKVNAIEGCVSLSAPPGAGPFHLHVQPGAPRQLQEAGARTARPAVLPVGPAFEPRPHSRCPESVPAAPSAPFFARFVTFHSP